MIDIAKLAPSLKTNSILIIAELINENDVVRAKMRSLFEQTACIQTKVLADKETDEPW